VHHFLDNLVVFGRMLRGAGLQVGTDRLIDLAGALPLVDLGSREEVHATCRVLLVQRHEDFTIFDRVFDEFWKAVPTDDASTSDSAHEPPSGLRRDRLMPDDSGAEDAPLTTEIVAVRTWSDIETIANKDFAELTDAEAAIARAALARLTWNMAERRTRRWIPGRGSRIDLRRALSRSLRTGGEITTLPRRRRRTRRRPIVLLCDVSGSMERYTRTLLLFAHTLSRGTRDVEAFLFATRLTRITMELRAPRPDAAMTAVSRAVKDWSGGTRIGEALRTFHQRWRRRTLHGSSVVILISDGWDRGEPQLLRDEIARLHRSCHRLVWLNPLIGTADYAPLTRGLEAALPFVDDFLPVRTLRDVRELALHLTALTNHGRHRHLHLRRTARTGLGADDGSRRHRVVHPGM
jgi:uncharacterized protein with von Willebrand factor type A (vWA) domain